MEFTTTERGARKLNRNGEIFDKLDMNFQIL